jgi:hypothetical protein
MLALLNVPNSGRQTPGRHQSFQVASLFAFNAARARNNTRPLRDGTAMGV